MEVEGERSTRAEAEEDDDGTAGVNGGGDMGGDSFALTAVVDGVAGGGLVLDEAAAGSLVPERWR
jgi:hypothetical protein